MSSYLDELLGDDRPVFDPKCPTCGRFWGGEVTFLINGFGEVRESKANCGRCGEISPGVVCWSSDLKGGW